MKRSKPAFKKADAILTADIELRMYPPAARIDDYWEAMKRKIKWLRELQAKHDCPIFDGGDLFDKKYKVNPSHELIGWAIKNLPAPFYTVPGNHDLPGKSIENYDNSAMAVLERAGRINAINDSKFGIRYPVFRGAELGKAYAWICGFPWGGEIKYDERQLSYKNIALIHAMVYEEFEPWPGCEGYSAKELMALLPDFDLIVTGHHHQTFTRQEGSRLLVNPGSLMRNDADQIDHKPSVFLWYADTNTVKQVFVPIEQGVISREHIDDVKKREKRLDAFVEKLGTTIEHGIDFIKNLEVATESKKVLQPVKDKVWQYMEGK